MPKGQLPRFQDLAKLVADNAGSNFASHFSAPIGDPETTGFLQARAEQFTSQGQNFSSSLADTLTVDLGGPNFNENMFVAPLAPAGNDQFLDAVSRRLGSEATAKDTGAAFLVNRFVDPIASRRFGTTALRYTEYIVVLQLDHEQGAATIHRLLPSGLSTIGRKRIVQKPELVNDRKELNKLFPNASSFFKGPPNRLLCWNGERWGSARIQHVSFAETVPLSPLEPAFAPVEHQLVKLTDFEPEPFDQRLFRSMAQGIEHDNYTTPEGLEIFGPSPDSVRMYSIDITKRNGDGGSGTTWGPPSDAVISFACEGYNDRDQCLDCCNNAEATMKNAGVTVGVGVGAVGAAATPVAWWLVIVGAVIAGGTWAVAIAMGNGCRDRCRKPVTGGGGGVSTGGGKTHMK
ncbi:hypothetical protein CQ12_41160 [Bradyrhizobium jicamae]|uniref:Uncharacterized protein n=1 Tax=Bradyrhizobium jicamae TaxID=280332 RepID=A0A0R3M1D6_9BRAD|nr:hypothetical protein [Bradyrhizobium jicamae]KRR13852.1 hypothetical protein CQ12_41160 [Bradyrhizobium jicamae]